MKALLVLLGVICVAQAALVVRFNTAENAKLHRTNYRFGGAVQQTQALIIRGYDKATVTATQDPFPQGAEFILFDDLSGLSPIGNGKKPAEWKLAATVSSDRKTCTFSWDQGTIGRFLFGVRVQGKLVFLSRSRVYILFNPWNSKDVTSPSPADASKATAGNFYVDLQEYVLNEFGAVWRGSANSNSPMAWNYGHMDLGVLDIVMGLLAPLAPAQRTALLVSRFLTVAGQGVLEGRWPSNPNDYPGGNPPGFWTSSVQILYQYNKTGTVKYGQCWVFASLMTAMGRTLGLPTHTVTNFDSAHEQQPFKQQCHMRNVGPNAAFNRGMSTCSIWNFHVWNHVYIRRTDVPGAAGWQAIDATPQETSTEGPNANPFNEENYFTGPASLNLMRRGAYNTKYDAAFVGGESNAVIYRYHCATTNIKSCTQSEIVNNQVGEKMYAKMPDSLTGANVLGQSGYSRIAFLNWARQYSNVSSFFIELENGPKGSKQQQQQQQSLESGQSSQALGSAVEANVTVKGSVSFSVSVPAQLTIGNRFRVALQKKNGAKLTGKWMLTLVVRSVNYMTGAAIGPDHLVIHQVVNDMATNRQGLVRQFGADLWGNSTFLSYLAKSSYLSFTLSAVPANSNHKLFLTVETVNVLRPTLPVICGSNPNPSRHKANFNQGDVMHCVVKFFNPLKIAITGVKVQMTVSGLIAKEELKQVENQKQHKGLTQESVIASASDVDQSGQSVAGFRTIKVGGFQFTLNATAGKQQISATFLSNELKDVFGSNTIVIKPNPAFAKSQSVQSKMESQATKTDADADMGQTDEGAAQTKAAQTLEKAKKVVELAFQSKKASVGEHAKQAAKKITLVQHTKENQKKAK